MLFYDRKIVAEGLFGPPKTPEQKAAEARKKKIDDLKDLIQYIKSGIAGTKHQLEKWEGLKNEPLANAKRGELERMEAELKQKEDKLHQLESQPA